MTTKYVLLSLLYFASFSLSFAQVPIDIKEQERFKAKVIKVANNTKSMTGDFIQEKHLNMMDNVIISEGHLAFQSPNLVKWEYIKPFQNIALFKGDKLYVTNEGKKETLNLKSNKLFKSLNTLIINSIKGNMFDEEQFDISYAKTNDKYLVTFFPKEKRLKRFIKNFELQFSALSTEVEQVKLVEPNTDYTLIIFKNKQLNIDIPKDTFNH